MARKSGVSFLTEEDGLRAPPATKAERAWVENLAAVLRRQPKRFWLMECGDNLYVVDRVFADGCDLQDGRARRSGVIVADLGDDGCMKVTGVAG
jgi:hypothetical protein